MHTLCESDSLQVWAGVTTLLGIATAEGAFLFLLFSKPEFPSLVLKLSGFPFLSKTVLLKL